MQELASMKRTAREKRSKLKVKLTEVFNLQVSAAMIMRDDKE